MFITEYRIIREDAEISCVVPCRCSHNNVVTFSSTRHPRWHVLFIITANCLSQLVSYRKRWQRRIQCFFLLLCYVYGGDINNLEDLDLIKI